MNDTLSIVLTASAWAAGGGLAVWLVTMPLRRRSIVALLASIVLAGTVASVAAVIGSVHAMFLTTNELVVTVTVAIVAGLAAAIAAAAAGRRLTKDNRALRKAVMEVGLGRVPDDDGPKLTSQLDEVRRELSATARRLAASREREQALEASRRELVAWVSHDLRTPLAGLRAMTEALEDGVVDDPQLSYKRMHADVDRLATMVDDLFELSRIQSGTFAVTTERISLDDVVSDCLAALQPLATEQGVELRGHSNGALAVTGNVRELNRALTNLVANAIRHTDAGGTVDVALRGVLATTAPGPRPSSGCAISAAASPTPMSLGCSTWVSAVSRHERRSPSRCPEPDSGSPSLAASSRPIAAAWTCTTFPGDASSRCVSR